VLGLGGYLRLVNLNSLGFNSDEAVYAGQAASLAGNPIYSADFPVFRAHPMLVQSLLSLFFRAGEQDVVGRVVVAALGVLTLLVVYRIGVELYSRRVGLMAAGFLAVMPYHVLLSRQVLLDVPMVLFSTLTLLCVVKFAKSGRLSWMICAGAALGLTMLSKESSIVLVGAVYAFFALIPSVRRPVLGSLMGFTVTLAIFALHPVSVALSGHVSTTKAYLVWQLVRRPNHGFGFYAEAVPMVVGPLVLAFAIVTVWLVWRRRRSAWREVLLVSWVLVPVAAFTVWPVKGFSYLLPCAPAVALLAAEGVRQAAQFRFLPASSRFRSTSPTTVAAVLALVVGASLLVHTAPRVSATPAASGLAGTGGIPGGRETGHWIRQHSPEGAAFMTIGPSMANIIRYYAHRDAFGLSVSPNPLHRNPSYVPIENPDYALRHGDIQYLVWDRWSAQRSPHFSEHIRVLARRFQGQVVHREYAGPDRVDEPVIVVYAVRP
jgi:4-amino-4-deoxy-L-arabinose transferase-like glycosyltransferase